MSLPRPDLAWHFTGPTLRDGSPIPPVGHTLVFDGAIELCRSGYHWSRMPWQALRYAPGPLLHRVRVGGTIIEEDDKGVSSERTVLATIDATYLLRRFAADQALSVAHLWPMPDVVREYLTTLDEETRKAARSAANEARNAAWNAAWNAAESAALSAAWSAAESTALSAAWRAVESAALSAAWRAAAAEFNRRVEAAFAEISP